jgi:hypothetical protein
MTPEQHQLDFANAKAEAESLGYEFLDDDTFDEWLAQLGENTAQLRNGKDGARSMN